MLGDARLLLAAPLLLSWDASARVTEGLLSCFLMHHNLPKAGHCLAVTVQPWPVPPEWEILNELAHSLPFWSSVHMSSWGRWGAPVVLQLRGSAWT